MNKSSFPQAIQLTEHERNELRRMAKAIFERNGRKEGLYLEHLLCSDVWALAQYDAIMASDRHWLNFGLD